MSGQRMGAETGAAVTTGMGELRVRHLRSLERTPLFQHLPRKLRRKVAALTEFTHYADGDVIVRAGDRGDSFHTVLEGDVRVVPVRGRERVMPAETQFGELALIDGAPRAATVTAVGAVVTGRIARTECQRLLHDDPAFAVGLLPGLTLVIRDLSRTAAGHIPGHSRVDDWRSVAGDLGTEAEGRDLEGRDALGWLVLVRHVGVFDALAERHLRHIARHVTIQRYADGQTVVLAGARGDALYILLDGCAAVRTPSGHTRTLFPDDCFGELALIDGAPRAATVSAIGDLTVARITRSDFQKILHSEPGMAVGLLNGMVKTVRDLQAGQLV